MGQISEYIKMAVKSIRSNKGRSFLTMLGIIIGIGSVIMIMSIGDGLKSDLGDELAGFAGGQVYLYNNTAVAEADIDADDMAAIQSKVSNVIGVTPYMSLNGDLKTSKGEFDLSVNFGSSALSYVENLDMVSGRYISESDVDKGDLVAVIGDSDAIKIFGSTDVVGLTVRVTVESISRDVKIIGVKETGQNGTFVTYTYDNMPVTFDMPYTAMSAFDFYAESFYSIYIIADSNENASAVAQDAMDFLVNRKNIDADEDIYYVQDISSQVDSITQVVNMVTLFVALVAAISLLVGGIGVMNIMLVSVTERTREIGIRKALGAKTGYITMQFLAEAAIITLIGGVIGILIGAGGGKLVAMATGGLISSKIKVNTVIIATLFSTGVGIFFGIYPARRAAKLSPMEALRRD